MSELRELVIDGQPVAVDPEATLMQACEQAGVEIPRFCYHERLSIAGNCRMCLIDVVGGPPKPVASCAMQVKDLRFGKDLPPPEIRTNSPMARQARRGVMEFLLINHPLDCPICDQGGECDLQDQAMAYGVEFSRYREAKRAVEDPDLGPLVGTQMTRCISCTRCVRFTAEVAGVAEMGQIGRGEDSEITSYLGRTLESNLQGNIIDLCPVGALTSKPYAFTARPWELSKTETIDVMDALGANIRVDSKGRSIMRVLPRNHDGVNEEWISDKTRFSWDGLRRQRLDRPYIRHNGRLVAASWTDALAAAAAALQSGRPAALAGDLVPCEAIFALQLQIAALGGLCECRTDGAVLPIGNRAGYAGTVPIEEIDSASEIILVGTDPRSESPVLNARIRSAWLRGARIRRFGAPVDLTYPCQESGANGDAFAAFAEQRLAAGNLENLLLIIGQGALTPATGTQALDFGMRLAQDGAGLLILHIAASRVGAMDLGFACAGGLEAALDGASTIYNLGADELQLPEGPTVIYQGSHGDRGAHRADILLPAAAFTEENGLFVNTEGRPQLAFRATFPPGEARENWAILRALSEQLKAPLEFDDLAGLRAAMIDRVPHLGRIDEVPENPPQSVPGTEQGGADYASPVADFYLTNPIARASELMAKLSADKAARVAALSS